MRFVMKIILNFLVFFLLSYSFLISQGYQGKGKLRGFVYSEDGQPLEGVKVKLYSVKAAAGFDVFTDKKGEWKALWIRGGTWYLDFEKMGYEIKKISIEVKETERNPELEIRLKKVEGLVLSEELKESLEKGNVLFKEKKYKEAIEVFNDIVQKYPDAYIIFLNIGNCYFQLEDYNKAEESYKKVLEKDPKNVDAIISVGNCYINRGQREEALKWYSKIEFEKINDFIVLYNIGNSFYENSQFNEALKYYHKALELKDDFLDARYRLGLTYISLGKFKEALAEFTNYIKQDSESDRAKEIKGFIEYLKKEIEKNKL